MDKRMKTIHFSPDLNHDSVFMKMSSSEDFSFFMPPADKKPNDSIEDKTPPSASSYYKDDDLNVNVLTAPSAGPPIGTKTLTSPLSLSRQPKTPAVVGGRISAAVPLVSSSEILKSDLKSISSEKEDPSSSLRDLLTYPDDQMELQQNATSSCQEVEPEQDTWFGQQNATSSCQEVEPEQDTWFGRVIRAAVGPPATEVDTKSDVGNMAVPVAIENKSDVGNMAEAVAIENKSDVGNMAEAVAIKTKSDVGNMAEAVAIENSQNEIKIRVLRLESQIGDLKDAVESQGLHKRDIEGLRISLSQMVSQINKEENRLAKEVEGISEKNNKMNHEMRRKMEEATLAIEQITARLNRLECSCAFFDIDEVLSRHMVDPENVEALWSFLLVPATPGERRLLQRISNSKAIELKGKQ